jgi:hypothetical protein
MGTIVDSFQTWFITLREHRLRVFRNRVIKKIYGPKRDKLTRGWRKWHNELFTIY